MPLRRTLFALLLAACVYAASDDKSPVTIQKIDIVLTPEDAAIAFSPDDIRNGLASKEGAYFSDSEWDFDLKTLSKNKNYFRVTPYEEEINGQKHLTLAIELAYQVRSITFVGNKEVSTSNCRSKFGIRAGSNFNISDMAAAVKNLQNYYVGQSYWTAAISYEPEFDKITHEVDIVVKIAEGSSGHIKAIRFKNLVDDTGTETPWNKRWKNDIKDQLNSTTYKWYSSWFTGDGNLDKNVIEEDKRLCKIYMQDQGYPHADVTIEPIVEEGNLVLEVQLLHLGDKYTFGTIATKGQVSFSEQQILSKAAIQTGQFYSLTGLESSILNISGQYFKKGFLDIQVDYQPLWNEEAKTVDITFHIGSALSDSAAPAEGYQYKVGHIKIIGNRITDATVILNEASELLVPGEILDRRKLGTLEQRLSNMGYFSSVNVMAAETQLQSDAEHYKDVHITVEEKGTGEFSFTFGYNSRDSFSIGAGIKERNFRIRGVPRLFSKGINAIRGGGEYMSFKAQLGDKQKSLSTQWAKPFFMDTRWTVGWDVGFSRNEYQSNAYNIQSIGAKLHASYEINAFTRYGVFYRVRNADVRLHTTAADIVAEAAGSDGLLSGIGMTLNYNSCADPLRPVSGFVSSLSTELVGLGGTHRFIGASYCNKLYHPFPFWKLVGRVRFDVSALQPFGSTTANHIPYAERYFGGGPDTLRGFKNFSIGPKYSDGVTARGGITQLALGYEVNLPLFSRVEAFGYIDACSVGNETWNFNHIKAAAGIGVRVEVMQGIPVNVGYGYPINADNKADEERFFWSVGGRF